MMRKFIIPILTALVLVSCEEKEVIIPDFVVPATGKIVLLEDLTGVKCPNCPKAAYEIESLLEEFPSNLVAVGIHGTRLTQPIEGYSQYDFRNQFSIDLEDYHYPAWGKPGLLVDRVLFDGEDYPATPIVENVKSYVVQELNKEQEIELFLSKDYDEGSRQLDLKVGILPLVNLSGNLRISVFITESHIIDAQENNSGIIEDFEHNHVLRTMLTAYNGDPLPTSLKESQPINENFSYQLPEDNTGLWNEDNIDIVVAIGYEGTAGHRDIIQAASISLK